MEPEIVFDAEEVEYRARHARRRRIIAIGLMAFFVCVPGFMFLVTRAFF